jgi:hypothetical protein
MSAGGISSEVVLLRLRTAGIPVNWEMLPALGSNKLILSTKVHSAGDCFQFSQRI